MATAYEWRAINVMFIEHMIMSTDYIPKFDQDHFSDQSIREPDEMNRRIFDLGSLIRYVPGDCSVLRDADTLIGHAAPRPPGHAGGRVGESGGDPRSDGPGGTRSCLAD